MLENFTGWHVLIILVVVLIPTLVIVLLVVFLVRRSQRASAQTTNGEATNTGAPVTAALEDLELARARGHISEAEFETKRAEILRRL